MELNTALINMPFGFHIYPSIQLGTLSTILKSNGWSVKINYLNLHFAHQLGVPVYNQLCEKRFLIGEWLFSHNLFGLQFHPESIETKFGIKMIENFLLINNEENKLCQ